jgi:hypothetical protein
LSFNQQLNSIQGILIQQSLCDNPAIGTGMFCAGFHFAFVVIDIKTGIQYAEASAVDTFFVASDSIVHHHAIHTTLFAFNKI